MQRNDPQFTSIFGVNADDNTITTIPNAPSHGRASLSKGFPIETMTPLAAGGIPPNGSDMNGILKMLSISAQSGEAGLIRPFDSNYSKEIGGYPQGALVLSNGHLYLSQSDNNNATPPSDGSDSSNWKNILSDAFETVDGQYLPLKGGILSGNVIYGGEQNPGNWAGTPQAIFSFKSSDDDYNPDQNKTRLASIFGQMAVDADGQSNKAFQMLVHVQNGDRNSYAWGFRGDNGRIKTPIGATLLEAQSDDGRVKIRNLDGVNDGQILANFEDTTNKLPLAGGTMTGDVTFYSSGSSKSPWQAAPHLRFLLTNINGAIEIYGQIDDKENPQLVFAVPNADGSGMFWLLKQSGRINTPSNSTLLEAQSDSGRVKVRNLDGVNDGQILANFEDTQNLVSSVDGASPTDCPARGLYYRPPNGNDLDFLTAKYDIGNGQSGYINLKSYEWVNNTFQGKGDCLLLTGGTMTGDVTLPMAGGDTAGNTTPHLTFGFKGTNNTFQIYGQQDNDNNPQAVISVPQRGDGSVNFWSFKSNGGIYCPDGTIITSCTQPQRMIEQVFSVTGKDGDWFYFPRSFKSGDIGTIHAVVTVANNLDEVSEIGKYPNAKDVAGFYANNLNQWGFNLYARLLDGQANGYSMSGTFLVRAIGPA